MKKILITFVLTIAFFTLQSQTWTPLGPDSANISRIDFGVVVQSHILCADNGFYIYDYGSNTCEFFNYGGMPVTGSGYFDNEKIMVAMGNGSWSDGLYTFDLTTHAFEVIDWFVWPNFLHYHEATQTWWLGSDWGGLWKSEDGMVWDAVSNFTAFPCISIASQGQNMVLEIISDLTNGYWSDDNGISWYPSELSPLLTDIAFHYDNQLLGIFPGYSNSSGLWRSEDFGNSWQIEIYQDNMTTVCFDVYSEIIVGFDGEGLGIYHPGNGIDFINGGLPNLNINKIQVNPVMSAPAIFVSTDQGVYFSFDYNVGVGELETGGEEIIVSPNPANDELFVSSETMIREFEILDMNGNQLLKEIVSEKNIRIDLNRFSNGIYFLNTESERGRAIMKFIKN